MSIIHYDEYKNLVTSVLDKVPVLRTDQLATIIMRYGDMVLDDDINRTLAQSILTAIQRNGYVLMNEDGWAMTKSAYLQLTNSKFGENISPHGSYRIENELKRIRYRENGVRDVIKSGPVESFITTKRLEDIDAMWIIADMFPDSENFTAGTPPFNFLFIQEGEKPCEENDYQEVPSICYEVAYVSKTNENAAIAMMNSLPPITDEKMRESIKRIVILEEYRHPWMIPYCGVSHICKIDPESDINYSVVEVRNDDERWKDV